MWGTGYTPFRVTGACGARRFELEASSRRKQVGIRRTSSSWAAGGTKPPWSPRDAPTSAEHGVRRLSQEGGGKCPTAARASPQAVAMWSLGPTGARCSCGPRRRRSWLGFSRGSCRCLSPPEKNGACLSNAYRTRLASAPHTDTTPLSFVSRELQKRKIVSHANPVVSRSSNPDLDFETAACVCPLGRTPGRPPELTSPRLQNSSSTTTRPRQPEQAKASERGRQANRECAERRNAGRRQRRAASWRSLA